MINQTLFSAIGKEIHNNEYLKQNADIKLYNSGKIYFSDKKEKFTVVINNSAQAQKVLAKYGIENFGIKDYIGDKIDDVKSLKEKALDKIAEKTGLGKESSARRGARKKNAAATLATAAKNIDTQQKLIKDAAKVVKEVSPTTASKINRIAKQGEEIKSKAAKYAKKLDSDTAVKVAKEYAKVQSDLKDMQKEIIKSAEDKQKTHEDALDKAEDIKLELQKLKNKRSKTHDEDERKKIVKEIRELEDDLKDALEDVNKSELDEDELDEYEEAKRLLTDFSSNKFTAAFRANLIKNFSNK